eukprot:TRINITY_DN1411_c0_g1_i12.p1 TRINITY_DN1411_c0_g1~~TRINITY_DN1411_c0_g1_i12.p1  ORF type:complete len:317 (+),score=75.67 TRINITY_DN1411_c0_g1_i12:58-951(+)
MAQQPPRTPPLTPAAGARTPPSRSEWSDFSSVCPSAPARSPGRTLASRVTERRTAAVDVLVAKGVPPHIGTPEVARMVEAALGLRQGHVDERRSTCIVNRSVTFLLLRRPVAVAGKVVLRRGREVLGVVEASDSNDVRTKEGHPTVNARFVLCCAGEQAGAALRFRPQDAEDEALRLADVIQRATGLRCVRVAFPCRPHRKTDSQYCYTQLFVDFGDYDLAAEAVVRGDGFPCTVGGEPAALRLEPVDPSTFTKARWVECVPEPRTPTCYELSHLESESCSRGPPSLLDEVDANETD